MLGEDGHGKVLGFDRDGGARRGMARYMGWLGATGVGMARLGTWHGMALPGTARIGVARLGEELDKEQ